MKKSSRNHSRKHADIRQISFIQHLNKEGNDVDRVHKHHRGASSRSKASAHKQAVVVGLVEFIITHLFDLLDRATAVINKTLLSLFSISRTPILVYILKHLCFT